MRRFGDKTILVLLRSWRGMYHFCERRNEKLKQQNGKHVFNHSKKKRIKKILISWVFTTEGNNHYSNALFAFSNSSGVKVSSTFCLRKTIPRRRRVGSNLNFGSWRFVAPLMSLLNTSIASTVATRSAIYSSVTQR